MESKKRNQLISKKRKEVRVKTNNFIKKELLNFTIEKNYLSWLGEIKKYFPNSFFVGEEIIISTKIK